MYKIDEVVDKTVVFCFYDRFMRLDIIIPYNINLIFLTILGNHSLGTVIWRSVVVSNPKS